ncbi:thioredoxin domain-containing protein [Aeropyrum camini]|nr:thioredoxin domain-containing protein [Aeropyrum camini]
MLDQYKLALAPGRIPKPGDLLERAVSTLEGAYDPAYGGFGRGMKFPIHQALLLHARASLTGDSRALSMLTGTLDHMLFSGVYDLVEGGLHRYSITRDWRLPHYEKMLYDQAWIIQVLTEAYIASGDRVYLDFALSTLEFAKSWLWTGRGFASSVDADTSEGEGAYYTFTLEEAEAYGGLPPEAIGLFNLSREGNVFDEATGARTGRNLLHVGERLERAAEKLGLTPDRAWEVLWEARKVLINVRGGRERPRVDGKVLTDWNGMMLHALAHLYWATRDPQVLEPARALWRLVEERMDGDRISHACYGNAECVEGMLPDYAYPAAALTALYTVTGESEALETARSLVKDMIDLLWSPGGGYFRLSPPGPHNPDTPADVEDTAYPGAYGTAVHALLLVHRATGWMRAREAALRALRRVAARLEQDPVAHASLALATLNTAPLAVEVFAQGAGEGFRGEVLERVYNPYLVLHISPRPEDLRRLVEYAASMPPVEGGRPTFYICHGGVCCEPLKDKWSALDVVARLSKKLG